MMSLSRGLFTVMYRGIGSRSLSTAADSASKVVSSTVDYSNGVAVLTMNNKPTNAVDTLLTSQLLHEVETLDKDSGCKAVILTSKIPHIFSSGFDLPDFIEDFPTRFQAYWSIFQDTFAALYKTRLATVAAINGSAPPAACVLSMACDYRVMAEGVHIIGLNGPKVGIAIPFWLCDRLRDIIGLRDAERHLQLGTMFTPEQALEVGLVDELCDENEIMDKARHEIQHRLDVDDATRIQLKDYHRSKLHRFLLENKQHDIDMMVESIKQDSCQQVLHFVNTQLKNK